MKINITPHTSRLLRHLTTGALALGLTATAFAQGTAFTYQGRLTDGVNPATGTYDLRFTLYDSAGGAGTVGSPVPKLGVGVTNGLFTVALDFGAGLFNGSARWLEIAAKTNGAATYGTLTPRQALTPAPYALYAPNAGSLSGNVNQTFTGTVSFSPASGPPFAVGSTNAVANLNADLLDGRHAAAFWQLAGNASTTPGYDFLGTADNQPLELRVNGARALRLEYAGTAGIFGMPYPNLLAGTDGTIRSLGSSIGGGNANQIASAADFSFLGGGEHNTIATNAAHSFLGGGGGGTIGTNSTYAFLGGGQGNSIQANSRHAFLGGGENNSVAAAAFHSFLGGGAGNTIQVGAEESFLGGGYQNQIQTDAPFAVLGGGYGNWIGAEGGMVPGGRGNYVGGMYSFAAGYRAKAPLPGCFVWADANGVDFNTGVANSFNVRATGGLYFVTSINPDGSPASTTILRDGNLTCDGILTCKSLTVLGGADLAEPFAMSEQNVAPGTVVVIDGKNPGRLKLSTLPCDRKVAGVVSGANGIQPGVSMIQAETLEAGRNVALSGRVYVLADAASGSIEPGDLLTTSATPGHAMKVTDFYRAQGAILGKAMSGLKEGKGMVLVLVTLQ